MPFSRLVIALTLFIFAVLILVLAVWNFLPFEGDVLLFTAYTDDHYTLFTLDVERELLHQATRFDGNIYDPAWSADGERIAYVYERDIYVADASGRDARNLTNTEQNITNAQPVWSPDGGEIVFVSDREGNSNIFILNVTDGTVQNITEGMTGDSPPKWSPDGTTLLYRGLIEAHYGFYLHDMTDNSIRYPLALNEGTNFFLEWSPNSETIAFMQRSAARYDLMVWEIERDEIRQLVSLRENSDPNWSPDGERIVAVDRDEVGLPGILIVEVNSGEVMPLFDLNGAANIDAPMWSPDGETIAFRSNHEARIGLYTISARGGTPERITPDSLSLVSMPLWRP